MIRLKDISYVRFSVVDLSQQQKFLEDFGLAVNQVGDVLYARGTDASPFVYSATQGEPGFVAVGFQADSEDVLHEIAALDGVEVESNSAPGGGLIAHLTDPDGFNVELVWGAESPKPLPVPSRSAFNEGETRPRLGARVTYEDQPCTIKRLGHIVLEVSDFRRAEAWYKERFGFITSDEVYAGTEDNALGAFMRCDRGDEHVDHHTLFLLSSSDPKFNHAAFEIANWDCLMAGHFELDRAGYQHSWGIGKHLLGSQVFDYWRDPNGFMLEHFTDGDLMNKDFGSHKAPVEQLLGSHWGPEGGPS